MATGDSNDMLSRLKSLIPGGWFADVAPIRDAVLRRHRRQPRLDTLAASPPFTAYVKGQRLAIKVANTNAGAVTGAVSGLPAKSFTRRDGSALAANDLIAGQVYDFEYNGTTWAAMSFVQSEVPRNVPSPTLWVRTDGNDNNDGSANDPAHAMATINGALAKAANVFNLTGRTLNINLGNPGTYASISVTTIPNVTVTGNPASPSSYVISGVQPVVAVGSTLVLSGVTLATTGSGNHWCQAVIGGVVRLGNVVFSGTAGGAQIALMSVAAGGVIDIFGNITCNVNAGMMFNAVGGSISVETGSSITQVGGPIYASPTANAIDCGTIVFGGGVGMSGTASGKRYQIQLNATIDTSGGGANFFPGTIAGVVTTGGQYN